MRVAVPYADFIPDKKDMYRSCCEDLVKNIKTVMPGQTLIHITDEKTKAIPGCDVLRIEVKSLPMTWRLLAQHYGHAMDDEMLYLEPDVRLTENILSVFNDPFDIAISDREPGTLYGAISADEVAPYTQGSTFSRSPDFWLDAANYCARLDRKQQLWFGDMYAIAHMVKSCKFNVRILDSAIYNHVPLSPDEITDAKVLHYKGKRKAWLFPQAEEAA